MVKAVTKLKKASQDQPTLPQLRNDIPSTPAGKLALLDLIGMGDVRRAVQSISPDERIEWDNEKSSTDESSVTRRVRKSKKRARSSSPLGSPATASAHVKAKTETLNPQLDPGSEIWGRYSLNGSGTTTPQGPIPNLAYIMPTSSPRPSKESATPRSIAGLRRANSCGTQFPKRRRVGGHENDDVFTEPMNIGPSKLSVLIERVQEGLSQPKAQLVNRNDAPGTPKEEQPTQDEIMEDISSKPPGKKSSHSSDDDEFDDDELDATLLEDIVLAPIPVPASKPAAMTIHVPLPLIRRLQEQKESLSIASSKSKDKALKAEKDEFDDSDDDIFCAVASQFDKGVQRVNAEAPAVQNRGGMAPQKVPISKADSDDEFGDDGLDDLDFEEAEASATQSIQQTANSLIPVRSKFL
jgi:hypothetical protein